MLKRMIPQLYDSLATLRNTPIKGLIEEPVVVDANTSASKIIGILMEKNAYEAFIPVSHKIASISIRDMIGIRDITSTKPSLIGKIVPSLTHESSIGYAARIMSYYRLRALPVVDHNEIMGQITSRSIVRSMKEYGIRVNASDIMTPNPVLLSAKDKASTARGIMLRRKIDHLPVMEEEKVAGIVTSIHIANAMVPSEKVGRRSLGTDKLVRLDFPVIGIADRNLLTCNSNDTLRSLIDLIISKDSTYTIVKTWDEIQGIITHRDIVALLEEKVEEETPLFIIGLPDDPFDAELAKSKFSSIIKLLKKTSPEIEEARCHMKLKDAEGERRRYEVDVSIITPYRRHTYTIVGWDLARIFDEISDAMKKKLAHRPRRRRESVRYRTEQYTERD